MADKHHGNGCYARFMTQGLCATPDFHNQLYEKEPVSEGLPQSSPVHLLLDVQSSPPPCVASNGGKG